MRGKTGYEDGSKGVGARGSGGLPTPIVSERRYVTVMSIFPIS